MTTNNPDPLEEDIARTLSCHLWATIVADNNDDCDEFDAMPDYIKDIYRRAAAAIIAQHYAPVIAENEAETGWLIEREGMALWLTLTKYCDWTADSNDALRFARKRDAEAFIADCGLKGAFATEHRWD